MTTSYGCDYRPSQSGGHWHTSKAEADRCIAGWRKWRSASSRASRKNLYANEPHGAAFDKNRLNPTKH